MTRSRTFRIDSHLRALGAYFDDVVEGWVSEQDPGRGLRLLPLLRQRRLFRRSQRSVGRDAVCEQKRHLEYWGMECANGWNGYVEHGKAKAGVSRCGSRE